MIKKVASQIFTPKESARKPTLKINTSNLTNEQHRHAVVFATNKKAAKKKQKKAD